MLSEFDNVLDMLCGFPAGKPEREGIFANGFSSRGEDTPRADSVTIVNLSNILVRKLGKPTGQANQGHNFMPNQVLSAITNRTSARQLALPSPTRGHIASIIQAGMSAPDHGRLQPWRFIVLEGAARGILGEAMAESLRSRTPDASPARIDAERNKPNRAPTIIVVAARITPGKIPEVEQLLAVGAATQNMCLAAQALRFGTMWKTGAAAYDSTVKHALGLREDDHIVAFLYLGTVALPGVPRQLSDSDEGDKIRFIN